MSGNDVEIGFGARTEGFDAGVDHVKDKLEEVNDEVDKSKNLFEGLGPAIAGAFSIGAIAKFTESVVEFGSRLEDMSAKLGMSVHDINVMKFAVDGNEQKMNQLSRAMTTFTARAADAAKGTGNAAAAFDALGINVKKFLDEGGTMKELFDTTTSKINTYKDSLEKTNLVADIYGQKSTELIDTLRKYTTNQEEAAEAVARTGVEMKGFIDQASETNKKTTEMQGALSGVAQRIFSTFKPAIDGAIDAVSVLAEWFNKSYDEASVLRVTMELLEGTLKTVVSAVVLLTAYFSSMWGVVQSGATQAMLAIRQVGVGLKALATGDLDGAKNAWTNYKTAAVAETDDMIEKVIAKHEKAVKRLKDVWNGSDAAPKAGQGSDAPDAPDVADEEKVQSQIQVWEAALNKMLLDKQIFGQAAEKEELAYWTNILNTAKMGAEERANVERKIYALQSAMWADAAREAQRVERERLKAMERTAKELERLNQKAVDETTKKWERFFKSFNGGLIGMAKGAKTWQEGVRDIFWNLVDNFLTSIGKMAAAWIAKETVQTAATATGNAARTATDLAAAKTSSNAFGEAGKKTIMGDAAKAYGGVYGFLAPEIGPFAAIPAALAFASVAAMSALIPSYDVGSWNIPNDHMAMVHKGEMIIPAAQAQAMREGGGGSGGGITINGDVYGYRDFQAKVAQAVGSAQRNFNPNLTRGLK